MYCICTAGKVNTSMCTYIIYTCIRVYMYTYINVPSYCKINEQCSEQICNKLYKHDECYNVSRSDRYMHVQYVLNLQLWRQTTYAKMHVHVYVYNYVHVLVQWFS